MNFQILDSLPDSANTGDLCVLVEGLNNEEFVGWDDYTKPTATLYAYFDEWKEVKLYG